MSIIRFAGSLALAAALVCPLAASAQTPSPAPIAPGMSGTHRKHHANRFRAALRSLNLSAAQQTQIDQIFAQARGQNRNADPATRKANRQKLRAQIEAVLTPAQRAQLQAALRNSRNSPQR